MFYLNNQRQSKEIESLLSELALTYATYPVSHLRSFPQAQVYAAATRRYGSVNRRYGANLNVGTKDDFQYYSGQFIQESEHCRRLLTQHVEHPSYTDEQFLSQVKHSLENLVCIQYDCAHSLRPRNCSLRNQSWHIRQLSRTEHQLIELYHYCIELDDESWLVALLQQHIEFLGQCIDQLNCLANDLCAYQRPYPQGNTHRFASGGYGSPYNSTGFRANSYAQQAPNHAVQSDLNEVPETDSQPVYETAADAAQQPVAALGPEDNTGSVAMAERTVTLEKNTGEAAFATHDTPVAADHTNGTATLHAVDTSAAYDQPSTGSSNVTNGLNSIAKKAESKRKAHSKKEEQNPFELLKPFLLPLKKGRYFLDGIECSEEYARQNWKGKALEIRYQSRGGDTFISPPEQDGPAPDEEEKHSPKVLH